MMKVHLLAAFLAGLLASPAQALPAASWQDDAANASVPKGVRVPSWGELSATQRSDLARFERHWDQMPASRRVARAISTR